jgi:integrase
MRQGHRRASQVWQFSSRVKRVKEAERVSPVAKSVQGLTKKGPPSVCRTTFFIMSQENSSEGEEGKTLTPPELIEKYEQARTLLLPKASKDKYDRVYKEFLQWRIQNKTESFSERTILAYLSEKQKKVCPSTLWSHSSMLKATLRAYHAIDLESYPSLHPYLKQNSVGHMPKKASIFQQKEIDKFLIEAPDEQFLMRKVMFSFLFNFFIFFSQVAVIFGIAGACRREELTNMDVKDVVFYDDHVMVTIPDTKTHKPRTFAVVSVAGNVVDPVAIIRQYNELRPKDIKSTRFFFKYVKGKGVAQVVGIHTMGKIPHDIATFLALENPENFTGHAFRRSSASWLADSGADKDTIMRHGGWKSSTVAEGYVETSGENKKRIAGQIFSENVANPPAKIARIEKEGSESMTVSGDSLPVLKFENCTGCTININFNK